MGRENRYFKVGGLRFLQALTPQERYSRFIVASPSGPLSRHRERGWGERADTPVATLGAILCWIRRSHMQKQLPLPEWAGEFLCAERGRLLKSLLSPPVAQAL